MRYMYFRKLLFALSLLAVLAGCSRNYSVSPTGITGTLPIPKAPDGADGGQYGICRISVANLREEPAYEAEMGTQLLMGAVCRVIEKKSYWLKVEAPDGYTAWVTEGSLHPCDASGIMAWKATRRLFVTAAYTPVTSAPGKGGEIVCDAVRGCIVACTGSAGRYWRCRLPDGREGYIARNHVCDCREYFSSRNPSGKDIIADAKLYLGVPYLWGGSSAKGLDCSGLSQRVYMDCGILLPRNASQQARVGEDIDISGGWDNLQPGDLVFFSRKRDDGSTRVYHVAIYKGDGEIIQSSKGCVHIASIVRGRGNYYPESGNIVSARRILGSDASGKDFSKIIFNGWYF